LLALVRLCVILAEHIGVAPLQILVHAREAGVPLNLSDSAALMSSLAVEGRWLLAESLFFFSFCFIAELVMPPPVQMADLYSTPAGDAELVEFLYGARRRLMGTLTPAPAPVQPAQPPPFEPQHVGTGLQPLTAPSIEGGPKTPPPKPPSTPTPAKNTPSSSQELGRSQEVKSLPDVLAASQASTSEPCVEGLRRQVLTTGSGVPGICREPVHASHGKVGGLLAAAGSGSTVLGLENTQMSEAVAVPARLSSLQLAEQGAGHRQQSHVEEAPLQTAVPVHSQVKLSAELQMRAQPGYSYGSDMSGELMCCNELLHAYAGMGKMERAQHLLLCMMR
jgi:hypothetical protein